MLDLNFQNLQKTEEDEDDDDKLEFDFHFMERKKEVEPTLR